MKKSDLKFSESTNGDLSFIKLKGNRIIQVACEKEMYEKIIDYIKYLSQNNPMIEMGEEHDLILKIEQKILKSEQSEKKSVDDYYKEWCGESHLTNSGYPVHDSADATDFAEYYHNEKTEEEKI